MKLKTQLIDGKIIFDNSKNKFMTKKQMIKFAEDFWEQGMRDNERNVVEDDLKKYCKEWHDNFDKEYLKMKIDYLFDQFTEVMWNFEEDKFETPFNVWDASDEETWELVEIPEQIMGIFIDDDGEERLKRIKEMIQLQKKSIRKQKI